MPLRAKVATSVSRTAAALSRAAGRGDGSVIGGWIGLKIDPDLLRNLAAGRADRAGVRHQRQDHHDPVHRRRARRARPGRHQLLRRQHAHRAHLGAGQGRRHPVRGARGRRALPGPGHRRDQPPGRRAAQPLPRPARPGQGGGDDGADVAHRTRRPPRRPRGRQRRRPDGGLGGHQQPRRSSGSAPGQRWHDDSWVCPECGSPDRARRRRLVVHRLHAAPPARRSGRSRTRASSTPTATGTWSSCSCPARSTSATRPPRWPSPPSSAYAPIEARPPARRRSPRWPAGTPRSTGTAATSGCCWPRTRPAGWRPSTWPRSRPTLLSINARDPDGFDTSWLYDVDFSPLRGRPGADHRRPGLRPRGSAGSERSGRSGTLRPSTRRSGPARRAASK